MEKVFEEMFVTKKKSLLEEINNENCTYEEAEKIIKENEHILNKHTTMVGKFCAAYHITLFNLHRTNAYQKALEILDSKLKPH